jgi:hypothetical protein
MLIFQHMLSACPLQSVPVPLAQTAQDDYRYLGSSWFLTQGLGESLVLQVSVAMSSSYSELDSETGQY